jgi:hypothetical protein
MLPVQLLSVLHRPLCMPSSYPPCAKYTKDGAPAQYMPRGALNTEGPKNQNPRPFAQTAHDKDGVPGLLSFTWAATPAAQDLRGDSTQRVGRSVHRYVR